jgi:hypothetical protein
MLRHHDIVIKVLNDTSAGIPDAAAGVTGMICGRRE